MEMEHFRGKTNERPNTMQTNLSVVETSKLHLFVLYSDFPAGIRAKHMIAQIGEWTSNHCRLSSEMWKLDSVFPAGPIRQMIAQGAAESDLLVIAVSSPEQPDVEVSRWLDSLVPWKTSRSFPGLVVGLFGDEEHEVQETSWLILELAGFANKTRMNFVWRAVNADSPRCTRWLETDFEKLLTWKRSGAA
jgi:hypothetical protein